MSMLLRTREISFSLLLILFVCEGIHSQQTPSDSAYYNFLNNLSDSAREKYFKGVVSKIPGGPLFLSIKDILETSKTDSLTQQDSHSLESLPDEENTRQKEEYRRRIAEIENKIVTLESIYQRKERILNAFFKNELLNADLSIDSSLYFSNFWRYGEEKIGLKWTLGGTFRSTSRQTIFYHQLLLAAQKSVDRYLHIKSKPPLQVPTKWRVALQKPHSYQQFLTALIFPHLTEEQSSLVGPKFYGIRITFEAESFFQKEAEELQKDLSALTRELNRLYKLIQNR